jgi:hypothetical protein
MCSSLSAIVILTCSSIKAEFDIMRYFSNAKFLHAERNIAIRNNMSNDDTEEEALSGRGMLRNGGRKNNKTATLIGGRTS